MPYYLFALIKYCLFGLTAWCFIGIFFPELMNKLEKDKRKQYTSKSMLWRTILMLAVSFCFIKFVPVEDKGVQTTGEANAAQEYSQQNPQETIEGTDNKPDPKEDLQFAKQVLTWYEESGLPINNVRNTTEEDTRVYKDLSASISSNPVNVLVFNNEENAKKNTSEEFNMYNVGRVLLWIKDDVNKDSYLRILTEKRPIKDVKVNYISPLAEQIVKNLDKYDSFKDFTQQFLKIAPPDRTKIYQTYLYNREFEWEGIVLDREAIPNGLVVWCGEENQEPKHWLDSNGKVETLSDIVVVELKDDDAKAYIGAGDQVKFKGKLYTIWNKEWKRNWKLIDAEIWKLIDTETIK
jgi:hypothetical protein